MIKLAILLFFLSPGNPIDCNDIIAEIISANDFNSTPLGEEAFLMQMNVRTEFRDTRGTTSTQDESLISIIHESGFCVKSNHATSIGEGNELFIIIPSANTIIESIYNKDLLPSPIQARAMLEDLLLSSDVQSCSEVTFNNDDCLSLSLTYDETVSYKGYAVKQLEFIVDPISYNTKRVVLHFDSNQKIVRQTIDYLLFDKQQNKSSALTKDFIYNKDGSIKDQFNNYEIVKQ